MSLAELGFTELQERTYRRLLAGSYGDLDLLAERLGSPREQVRAALAELVELGVLQTDAAEPLGIRVPRPTVAVGQLIERLEDDLMRRYRRISDKRAVLAELEAGYVHGAQRDDAGGIERVETLAAIRERLEELSFFTRSSVFAVQPGGPQSKASLDASRPLDQRGLRRGIDMRVIHDVAVLDDEINRTYLRELVSGGAQIRVTRGPLSRMVIMDREVAVVPLDPGDSKRGALIVRQRGSSPASWTCSSDSGRARRNSPVRTRSPSRCVLPSPSPTAGSFSYSLRGRRTRRPRASWVSRCATCGARSRA